MRALQGRSGKRSNTILKLVSTTVAAVALPVALLPASPASAHGSSDSVALWNVTLGQSRWASTPGTEPAAHHIVYSNWGYRNDWSVDIFAGPGTRVVSPYGTRTNTGHATRVSVVSVRPGCATGNPADGGYVITLQVQDTVTGTVLGRADLMHISSPQVGAGSVVGPWTTLGYLSRFRYTSCYQVWSDSGVHVHAEFIDAHKYSCYVWRSNGAIIDENTIIGRTAAHYGGQRATC